MIYLAPSIWRSMDPRTAVSIMAVPASNPDGERLMIEPLWNDALIARSRSMLATQFLQTEADVMVTVDDDIVWNPEDFWKIVEGARATRSIYCGPYVVRSEKAGLASRVFPGTQLAIKATPHRRPVEIEYAATGFAAIHRDVVEAMIEGEFRDADGTHRIRLCDRGGAFPFYPFFQTFSKEEEDGKLFYLSEDWAFSERARQLGFTVWMDQSIILEHMGWYPYSVADMNRPGESPYPSSGTDVLDIPEQRRVTGQPLLDSLIADIAAWAEEDPGDVRRMLPEGTALLARLWEERPADETEEAWYLREDVGMAYVADLAAWHLRGGGGLRHAYGLKGSVLDVGGGIGTFSLIASKTASVTYIEPNKIMTEFAAYRVNSNGLENGRLIGFSSIDEVPEGTRYDTVVAWHVFEHVADPEALLAKCVAHLQPWGTLITQSDFCQHDTHPMHHDRDDWEDVLARHGLSCVSPDVYQLAPARVAA